MKQENITGIILRKRRFTENDNFYSILTQEGMHVEVLVKGAESQRSKRRAHLQSLNLVRGVLYHGRKHTLLQSVTALCSFSQMKENLEAILRVQVLCEVLIKSIQPEDPHPKLFHILHDLLHHLNQPKGLSIQTKDSSQNSSQLLLIEAALIQTSHHLGWLPSFKQCSECHSALSEDSARWCSKDAILLCHLCNSSNENPILILKYRKVLEYFRINPIQNALGLKLQNEELSAVKELLSSLLSTRMEYKLKSLECV
jgi:DNA repair protein RecO